jgi:hypothetical protein
MVLTLTLHRTEEQEQSLLQAIMAITDSWDRCNTMAPAPW